MTNRQRDPYAQCPVCGRIDAIDVQRRYGAWYRGARLGFAAGVLATAVGAVAVALAWRLLT